MAAAEKKKAEALLFEERILPVQARCLSGSALKLIACATMLLDHVAGLLFVHMPQMTATLFVAFNKQISWYYLCRSIGRIAFPIFVFLLVEGFFHTRNRVRYGVSLAIFALISEPIWDYARFGTFAQFGSQNVFFTLLIGYLAMCAVEELRGMPVFMVFALAYCVYMAFSLHADYGPMGLALILVTYGLRSREALRDAASICVLQSEAQAILAYPLLALYNGKRGFVGKSIVAKYAFYAFYPVHLLVLGLILHAWGIH